ncbi:MAG: DUF1566 domain-containing protein [Desulforhopalus sp.]
MIESRANYPLKLAALFLALMMFIAIQSISAQKVKAGASISLVSKGDILETANNKMWQRDRSKKIESPNDVENYLQSLNQGSYNDWRLPTKQELYDFFTIFDFKKNGSVKIRLEGYYWLADDRNSSVYVGGWQVGDGCGPSRSFHKGKKGYVRAVRP